MAGFYVDICSRLFVAESGLIQIIVYMYMFVNCQVELFWHVALSLSIKACRLTMVLTTVGRLIKRLFSYI